VEVLWIHVIFHLVLACWRIDRKTMRSEFTEIVLNTDTLGAEETSMAKKDKIQVCMHTHIHSEKERERKSNK